MKDRIRGNLRNRSESKVREVLNNVSLNKELKDYEDRIAKYNDRLSKVISLRR